MDASLENHPLYQNAMAALAKGDSGNALSLFHACVEQFPTFVLAWNNMGVLLFRAKLEQEAEGAFLKALSIQPDSLDAIVNLFFLYESRADKVKAEVQLKNLERLDPQNPELPPMRKALEALNKMDVRVLSEAPPCTVVMATYNRPGLLANAIESVLKQSYPKFELAIVNDGGCDVRDVIARYPDPRLRYFPLPRNFGAAHAYNYAIYQTEAPLIGYLADDDILYPNHLESLVTASMQNPSFGAWYSDQNRVSCDLENGVYTKIHERRVDYSMDFDKILMISQTNYIPHPCLVHKRLLFQKSGFYDEKLSVLIDWDLLRRMAFHTDFLHIPVVTGEYYYPHNKKERISNIYETDPEKWSGCQRRVFSKRPLRPWDRIEELDLAFYCSTFTNKTIDQVNAILRFMHYPSRLFVLIDQHDPSTNTILNELREYDIKIVLNVQPLGLQKTVGKCLQSYFNPANWLYIIDEQTVITEPWFQRFFGQMKSQIRGTYVPPTRFETDRLFTSHEVLRGSC